MVLKLSRKVTKLIIYLLRRNECLWDVTNPHYSIRACRQEALLSMTKEVEKICPQATVSDVRAKIKNLRTQYRKQYNIIEQSKRDVACGSKKEIAKCTLWCFDILNFLIPVLGKKPIVPNEKAKLYTVSEDSIISRSFGGHKSLCSWTYKERFKYFERSADDSARCKLCKSVLKCSQSTAPLARHLYHRHQIDTSYNGAEKSRFLKSRKELMRLDAELRHQQPNSTTDSNFDPMITESSEDEFEVNANCTDNMMEENSHVEKMPMNALYQVKKFETFDVALIEEMTQNDVENMETTYTEYHETETDRSSPANAEEYCYKIHKLKAETRYYNEMAGLARAKRIMIELQSEKLKLELAETDS